MARARKKDTLERDLNPTAEALLATYLFQKAYLQQPGGCMTFWDNLEEAKKRRCEDVAQYLRDADAKHRGSQCKYWPACACGPSNGRQHQPDPCGRAAARR